MTTEEATTAVKAIGGTNVSFQIDEPLKPRANTKVHIAFRYNGKDKTFSTIGPSVSASLDLLVQWAATRIARAEVE